MQMNHPPLQNGNRWEPEACLAFVNFKETKSQPPYFSDASSLLRRDKCSKHQSSSPTTHRKSMTAITDESKATATANDVRTPEWRPNPEIPRISLELDVLNRPECQVDGIIGISPPMRNVLAQVKIVAPTDSTILLLGETGTGKELIARALHNQGSRRDRPFVRVNCAAIPSGLLESELFGHERGSFTGAIARKIGRFELAHGGTRVLAGLADVPVG